MVRRGPIMAVLGFVLLACGWFAGVGFNRAQPKPVYRGQLYSNWTKLGLTDQQRQDIYKLQGEHRAKIAELTKQIKELQKDERISAIKVLNPAQRERLKEVGSFTFRQLLEEIEKEEKKPEGKPKDEPKPETKAPEK